jgi:hypothetical protein
MLCGKYVSLSDVPIHNREGFRKRIAGGFDDLIEPGSDLDLQKPLDV